MLTFQTKSLLDGSQAHRKPLDHRSKLHTNDTVNWLRKRHQKTASLNYVFFPEEIQAHTDVQDVFNFIDEDSSGKLGLMEFYRMLKGININIKIEDLKRFYKKFDLDNDSKTKKLEWSKIIAALDFQEFKNCTLSTQANFHFQKMMEKVRKNLEKASAQIQESQPTQKAHEKREDEDDEEEELRRALPFLPKTFGSLINYLAYQNKQKDLTNLLNNQNIRVADKFHKFNDLFDLKMDKDVYLEQYNAKLKRPKGNKGQKHKQFFSARESLNNSENEILQESVFDDATKSEIFIPADLKADENLRKKMKKNETKNFINEIDHLVKDARQAAKNEISQKIPLLKRPLVPSIKTFYDESNSRKTSEIRGPAFLSARHSRRDDESEEDGNLPSSRSLKPIKQHHRRNFSDFPLKARSNNISPMHSPNKHTPLKIPTLSNLKLKNIPKLQNLNFVKLDSGNESNEKEIIYTDSREDKRDGFETRRLRHPISTNTQPVMNQRFFESSEGFTKRIGVNQEDFRDITGDANLKKIPRKPSKMPFLYKVLSPEIDTYLAESAKLLSSRKAAESSRKKRLLLQTGEAYIYQPNQNKLLNTQEINTDLQSKFERFKTQKSSIKLAKTEERREYIKNKMSSKLLLLGENLKKQSMSPEKTKE